MNQSAADWDTFIARFSGAHLLQTAAWGDLKAAFGWQVSRVLVDGAGAQILFKKLAPGLVWAYIPKGPVGASWEKLWPLVDQECRRRRAVFLKVEPYAWEGEETSVTSCLPAFGFRLSPHQIQPPRTLIVDLRGSENEILARMKQKTRYNIRLAARKGVRVHPSDDIQRFHQLMAITADRGGFGTHSMAYYQKAYDCFAPQGNCALLFAEFEGELLSALMVFTHGETAWYFYGASSNQHRNLMAPYLAQWEAIRWARSKGCVSYDLWGVPDADLETLEANFLQRHQGLWGVYRFKRGFGGQLRRAVGAWDRVYNPLIYSFYRLWMRNRHAVTL